MHKSVAEHQTASTVRDASAQGNSTKKTDSGLAGVARQATQGEMTIGSMLRSIREGTGLSQKDFGARIGEPQARISARERGAERSPERYLQVIADEFQLDKAMQAQLARLNAEFTHRVTALGTKLRELRKRSGIKMQDVASAISVSTALVYFVENGVSRFTKQQLTIIAELFNIDGDEKEGFISLGKDPTIQETAVGIKIRELREERGITQTELARRVGCPQSVISAAELGVYVPRRLRLKKIATEFGLEGEERERFIGLGGSKQPPTALGRKIAEFRERAGLTQKELLEKTGIRKGLQLENSTAESTNYEYLIKIAQVLRLDKAEQADLLKYARIPQSPELADTILQLRRRAGMTQIELAAAIERKSSAIADIETRRRGLSSKLIDPISTALGISPEELIEMLINKRAGQKTDTAELKQSARA